MLILGFLSVSRISICLPSSFFSDMSFTYDLAWSLLMQTFDDCSRDPYTAASLLAHQALILYRIVESEQFRWERTSGNCIVRPLLEGQSAEKIGQIARGPTKFLKSQRSQMAGSLRAAWASVSPLPREGLFASYLVKISLVSAYIWSLLSF